MPLYSLSHAQYASYLAIFKSISQSDKIGKQEVKAILGRRGVQADDHLVQKMIDSISVDSTGISLQAFIDYVSSIKAFRDTDSEYAEAFRIYDSDGSGSLDRNEISYVMKKLGVEVNVDELLDKVDKNKDGAIQYDEFIEMIKTKF